MTGKLGHIADLYQQGVPIGQIATDVGWTYKLTENTLRLLREAGEISGYRRPWLDPDRK